MTDTILVIAVEIAAQAEDVIEADQGAPRERVIVETTEMTQTITSVVAEAIVDTMMMTKVDPEIDTAAREALVRTTREEIDTNPGLDLEMTVDAVDPEGILEIADIRCCSSSVF